MIRKSIKIKQFGPIHEGFVEKDGYIPFSKVMIFCGPQGAGKSSVAKLYSTLSWIEKALVRGDFNVKYLTQYNRFVKNYCAYQNIQNYFNDNTFLHYCGEAYDFIYEKGHLRAILHDNNQYLRPQIIYIPAERNILSVLEKAENVKGLPSALNTLMDEFTAACRNMKTDIELPINDVRFRYDKLNKLSWIESTDYTVRLSESSSGMQSVTPLYVVLDYLSRTIGANDVTKSQKEREAIRKRIDELLKDDSLDAETRKLLIGQTSDTSNKYLLSIVEEPEQNLYPSSQQQILNRLLAINSAEYNQLVMTTHSPYIINYLSLAIKAAEIMKRLPSERSGEFDKIVPVTSTVDGKDVNVYEVTDDGRIAILEKYDDMPSDMNQLNEHLNKCNDLFGQLLEFEDSL